MSISKAHSGFKCLILNIIGTFEKWFTMELIPFQWQLSPGPLKLLASYVLPVGSSLCVYPTATWSWILHNFFLILCMVFWDCRSVFYIVHVMPWHLSFSNTRTTYNSVWMIWLYFYFASNFERPSLWHLQYL